MRRKEIASQVVDEIIPGPSVDQQIEGFLQDFIIITTNPFTVGTDGGRA